MDRTDAKILDVLQTNAALSVGEVAERSDVDAETCAERIKRLEDQDISEIRTQKRDAKVTPPIIVPDDPAQKILQDDRADLCHLATAESLQKQLPEILLLTFDNRLKSASQGEGLGL